MAVVTRPLRRPWMSGAVLVSTVTVLAILLAWTLATTVFRVSPFVLPSPRAMRDELRVLLEAGYAGKPLYVHVAASLFRSLTGLVAGLAPSLPIRPAPGFKPAGRAAPAPLFGFFSPPPPTPFRPPPTPPVRPP